MGDHLFYVVLHMSSTSIDIYLQITNNTRVCSRHFKPEDYKLGIFGPKKGTILKSNAIPNLFNWSEEQKNRPNVMDKIRARYAYDAWVL